jgi:hypothetical protein
MQPIHVGNDLVILFLSPPETTPIPSPPFHRRRIPYHNLPHQTSSSPVHLQSTPNLCTPPYSIVTTQSQLPSLSWVSSSDTHNPLSPELRLWSRSVTTAPLILEIFFCILAFFKKIKKWTHPKLISKFWPFRVTPVRLARLMKESHQCT